MKPTPILRRHDCESADDDERIPALTDAIGRRSVHRTVLVAVACLVTLFGIGCSSSPTHPDESVIVTGELAATEIDEYPLPLTFEGLVRFTIEDLVLREDGVVVEAPLALAIGFGLGRPTETGCQGTSRLALTVGQARTYRLLAEVYCIALFDPGTLGEANTLSYSVLAETTD